ncbi:MAG: HPr family phosphocarrier protein [Spirochaetaceae bacterium]|nr:HPr family phosphocarrier protein [Spirochaetaceae bacterium]
MYSVIITVTNKSGLHARPASDLTMKAKEFSSSIIIRNLDLEHPVDINAKSVVKIMAGKIKKGTRIKITAQGEDEKQAVDTLVDLLASGFGE